MKKIAIFTFHDLSSLYSCLLYLKNRLEVQYHVDIWSYTDDRIMIKKNETNFFSFKNVWYGHIRRFRKYSAKIHCIIVARKYDTLILNDLDFFRSGYIIKMLYPKKTIIHYNTEIHGKELRYPWHTELFYKNHADYPDMIIECLKERAEYRKNTFNIKKEIYTINNTLPHEYVKQTLNMKKDISKYFCFEDINLPTLIYAGGCELNRSLEDILSCVSYFEGRLNFLFFCHGAVKDFERVQVLCAEHLNCQLFHAVDKVTLFNVMAQCDIGIQYYRPEVSINYLLASPSKFYEYISVGLNVVSSNNHGIDRIIKDYDLGVCFTKEEGIKGGIEKLLKKGLNSRENIKKAFREYLCYEVDSKETINAIKNLMKKN